MAGLTEDAVTLYRRVLRSPAAELAVHAEALGWTPRHAQRPFRSIERLGLAREAADDGEVSSTVWMRCEVCVCAGSPPLSSLVTRAVFPAPCGPARRMVGGEV